MSLAWPTSAARAGLRLHLHPAVLPMQSQRLVIASTRFPLEWLWWTLMKGLALHVEDQAHVQAVTRISSALEETRPLTQAFEVVGMEVWHSLTTAWLPRLTQTWAFEAVRRGVRSVEMPCLLV